VTYAGLSSTWQRLAGFKQGNDEPVLHTSEGLSGQAPILHASVCSASQVTTEPNTVLILDFSDSDTVTSQFYEDGSVVVNHLDMYCTNVLMYHTMVLLAHPTKVRC
jgi:hypothetical protein